MADIDAYAAPASQAGSFNAEGRIVASGRGWDWIVEAWALFRKQPGMWILIMVIAGILVIAISAIPILGSLASTLLMPVLGAGLMLGCRAQEQGGALELAHLFAGFKQRTGDLVLVGVVNLIGGVLIALAFTTVAGGGVFMAIMSGGSAGPALPLVSILIGLLLVAGLLLPLTMALWFAPALIVLHEMAPVEALKASFFACLRNWLPFLIYGVVMLVLSLAAAIPAGLGYLVLIPVLVASVYTAYRDIFLAAQA
jgi:uncharacterized membrane protein